MQIKIERRFSGGFHLLNSFTWSKAIDAAACHLEVSYKDNSRVHFFDINSEKGISNYNQPINNTSTIPFDIPYGQDRAFGKNIPSLVNAVLGGWHMTGINTMTSGQPCTLRYSAPSSFQVSGMPSYRPNVIGPILTPESARSIDNYLNKTNVVAPAGSRDPFGSASRNMTRGYAFYNFDLGLHKQFRLPGEDRRVEFRSEFFNIFNHTNFVIPDATVGSATYGLIRGTFPAHLIQFGVKSISDPAARLKRVVKEAAAKLSPFGLRRSFETDAVPGAGEPSTAFSLLLATPLHAERLDLVKLWRCASSTGSVGYLRARPAGRGWTKGCNPFTLGANTQTLPLWISRYGDEELHTTATMFQPVPMRTHLRETSR